MSEYLKYNSLSKAEIAAFYDLIALYHFALQATIIEIFGIDCVDKEFFDRQLNWLYKWREQREQNRDILALQTDELLLKTVTTADIEEVARMWNYPHGSISYQEAQKAINDMCSNHKKNKIGQIYHLCFAVFEKVNEDKIIGWCGIGGKSNQEETVLFYAIDEQYRNKGYATQCANALLKYAFETVQLGVLNGGCDKDNIGSYRVMEKIGMIQNAFSESGNPLFYINQDVYLKEHAGE